MVSFIIIIATCVLFTSVVGNIYYARIIRDQNSQQILQNLQQAERNVDLYIKSVADTLFILSKEKPLIEFMSLDGEVTGEGRVQKEGRLRELLDVYTGDMPHILGLLVSCENGRYVSNQFYCATKDPLNTELWYKDALADSKPYTLIATPIRRNLRSWREYSNNDIIMLNMPVFDPDSQELLGVLSVDLSLDEIKQTLEGLSSSPNGSVFLMDDGGNIVYAPTSPVIYRVRPEWFTQNSKKDSFSQKIKGEDMNFYYSTSEKTAWRMVGMFPQNYKSPQIQNMQSMVLLLSAVAIGISIIIAIHMTRTVTKPIHGLQLLMKHAEDGDFSVKYSGSDSSDIDLLGNSFNSMIEKIDDLLSMVVVEQNAKRKAEIRALQEQINPHFLYNTLDTIHWIAEEHNADEITQIVSALTKFFRISLSGGREFITLKDELEHLKSYLYIQKIRYEEKLSYSLSVDEALLDSLVPKLSIQPIVENAIYHGIKHKSGDGNLKIIVEEKNNDIVIDVFDDGVGVSKEQLTRLQDALLKNDSQTGYGMFNVNKRLVMHFGKAYQIAINSTESGGFHCRLRYPKGDTEEKKQ